VLFACSQYRAAVLHRRLYPYSLSSIIHRAAADSDRWLALVFSGLIGFFVGIFLLFKACVIIGSRMSMLVLWLAPALAAMAGAVFLDDRMSGMEIPRLPW
jgi:drug/metabolite transporter (DMT)-like permease